MKKTIIKAALAVVLILAMAFSLAACGNTSGKVKDAENANGAVGTVNWAYNADTKTLTLTGNGDIADFASSDEVAWKSVRHSAEKVEIAEGITKIGNYAFYYFPQMKSVTIPASVTSIGNQAFAFCSSIEGVNLPVGLTSIGEGCFEGCTALKSITVHESVTSIGAKAFAYCSSLDTAIIMANITEIKDETFKNCKALNTLAFYTTSQNIPVAPNAYEGAAKSHANADFLASKTGEATLTIKYLYEDGREASPTYEAKIGLTAAYSVNSPAIEGFNASVPTVSGTITKDTTVEVKYTPVPTAETPAEEAPEETPVEDKKDDGISVGTVIAIVIFAIVIVAIIVFAVFMIRSDKKAKENAGKPVRNENKKSKKDKK